MAALATGLLRTMAFAPPPRPYLQRADVHNVSPAAAATFPKTRESVLLADPGSRTPYRTWRALALHSQRRRSSFIAYAMGGGNEETTGPAVATPEDDDGEPKPEEHDEDGEKHKVVDGLKQDLVNALYGTHRGMHASRETHAVISDLITQLEAVNPTPAPTEALELLNGKWILVYTSMTEFFPFMAARSLPMVKVGEISQYIDSEAFTVENVVSFEGPYTTTSFSTCASFDVRSPKRVQIKFEEGIIGTPQLTDSIEIPDATDFMGHKIDLKPLHGVLQPLQDAANKVAKKASEQPPLRVPYPANTAHKWLLTTYLDDGLRISRAEGGAVFALLKEGCPMQLLLSHD